MPVFRLDQRHVFPPPQLAEESGVLAVGGDLDPERVLLAYARGIFPWPVDDLLLWHSPDPRMVLTPDALHIGRSLRKAMRRRPYEITADTAFAQVIDACATVPREGQGGTWINPAMKRSYQRLHELGYAHSIEAWRGPDLVGGLYGISLGAAFFGESMFARASDASKIAFVTLVQQLARWNMPLVDCQVHTDHLATFGAQEWPRERFLAALDAALDHPTRRGPWRFDDADGSTAD